MVEIVDLFDLVYVELVPYTEHDHKYVVRYLCALLV